MENQATHNCSEHAKNGTCQIYGKHCHAWVQHGGGMGTGLVISWCYYCHKYEAYYDDTGTTVNLVNPPDLNNLSISYHNCSDFLNDKGVCAICGEVFPVKRTEVAQIYTEPLYEVREEGGKYYLSSFVDRKIAENSNTPILHLTVIIVPFVADGVQKGQWIVQDRAAKQWAKGKLFCNSPSYNFFGGHVKADISKTELLGSEIPQYILDEAAKRELSEELLVLSDNNEIVLEQWQYGDKTDKVTGAKPYVYKELIPVGMSKYYSADNSEISYFYALPVPSEDVPKLIAADDYDGKNVELPVYVKTEMQLLKTPYRTNLSYTTEQGEICDAITRLWDGYYNVKVYNKLVEIISNYSAGRT
ncbi:MAG: hypothetical protein LBI03_08080 [Clostridiales bacterium]|jgi:8-oxo-dGTP pyrophosphatase MutT (NUDIX family)|nr:hypothetical protein [Clostridiales bacterium]